MYLVTSDGKQIVNTEFVERFCLCEKPDAVLIIASYSREGQPVTIARYQDMSEGRGALGEMLAALSGGQTCFTMPDTRLFHAEQIKKDARTKRRGAS